MKNKLKTINPKNVFLEESFIQTNKDGSVVIRWRSNGIINIYNVK